MRNEILTELLNEYEQRRQGNQAEEQRRRQEAVSRCRGLEQLLNERQEIIFSGIRGILSSQAQAEALPEKMEALNRRIAALLEENGYPADWLEPVYRCPICKDTGFAGEPIREQCTCLRAAMNRKLYRQVGLADPEGQSFEKYDSGRIPDAPCREMNGISQRRLTEAIRKLCEGWANDWPYPERKDMLLWGKTGLGKTFMLNAMAKRLLEKNANVLLIQAGKYLELARRAAFDGDTQPLDAVRDTDVLLIDDLGTEPLMNNITIPQWFSLIEQRRAAGLCTVWSTNLSPLELQERYTERIASRLLDKRSCTQVQFAGQDLRRV